MTTYNVPVVVDRRFHQVTKKFKAQVCRVVGTISFWSPREYFTTPFAFWLDTGAPFMCIPPWITAAVGIIGSNEKYTDLDVTNAFGYKCIIKKVRVRFALRDDEFTPSITLLAKVGIPDGTDEPSDDRPLLIGMSLLEHHCVLLNLQFDSAFENDRGKIEIDHERFDAL